MNPEQQTLSNNFIETSEILYDLYRSCGEEILLAIDLIEDTFKKGGTLFILGNGGSAADAQHMAAELVGRFEKERDPYPAVALTCNSSVITSIANDYDYSVVFQRQVMALVKETDAVLGISTSGKSYNVITALSVAQSHGAAVIGLVGDDISKMEDLSQVIISVPSQDTQRIQECHGAILHGICELLEQRLTKDS